MGITKQQAITLLTETPYKIGHWLGFKDLTELHNEWLRSFLYAKKDQTLLAHRGSYKTTDLSLFFGIGRSLLKIMRNVTEEIKNRQKKLQIE